MHERRPRHARFDTAAARAAIPDVVREAVRRAVRAAVAEAWGKKPICTVFVAVV